jgi:hypothetical protein
LEQTSTYEEEFQRMVARISSKEDTLTLRIQAVRAVLMEALGDTEDTSSQREADEHDQPIIEAQEEPETVDIPENHLSESDEEPVREASPPGT